MSLWSFLLNDLQDPSLSHSFVHWLQTLRIFLMVNTFLLNYFTNMFILNIAKRKMFAYVFKISFFSVKFDC